MDFLGKYKLAANKLFLKCKAFPEKRNVIAF